MKKFMTIWSGELISNIGSGMTAFALAIYVYQLTQSVSWVSLVTILAYLPTILLNPIGGILADRFDRRLMMICGDLFSAFGLLYILISIQLGSTGIAPILIGVTVNSVFISLLEPSYKATISDLLPAEDYAKASGLVQMAGNAKYLISPVLAGLILAVSDIRLILAIDIGTIFVTVIVVACVRRTIKITKPKQEPFHPIGELKEGMKVISQNKGVVSLVVLMAFVCFFMGFIQTLVIPMVLPLSDAKTIGIMESVSAIGMLIGSVTIGFLGIKKGHSKVLILALLFGGIFMALTGVSTNIIFILIACIFFFMTLPFANTCADVLIRVSIPNEVQGRAWGLISVLTQIGYVVAYAVCGILADYIFEPLMKIGGKLSNNIGMLIGTGQGRGIALMLIVAGLLMAAMAFFIANRKSIKTIEV